MSNPYRIHRSIVLHVLALFGFHGALFAIVYWTNHLPLSSLVFWVLGALALHIAVLGYLLLLKDAFYFISDNRPMKTVGLPNLLSLFRITSAPSIVVLLMYTGGRNGLLPWLLAYIVVAFLTDFLDGWVSRSSGEVSRIGQYLDSSTDYVVLILFGFFFSWLQVIHGWFFWAVILRFSIQWILVGVLFLGGRRGIAVKATFLGKASVFATMTLFALALASLALFQFAPALGVRFTWIVTTLTVLEILVSILLGVSLIEKVVVFFTSLKEAPEFPPGSTASVQTPGKTSEQSTVQPDNEPPSGAGA